MYICLAALAELIVGGAEIQFDVASFGHQRCGVSARLESGKIWNWRRGCARLTWRYGVIGAASSRGPDAAMEKLKEIVRGDAWDLLNAIVGSLGGARGLGCKLNGRENLWMVFFFGKILASCKLKNNRGHLFICFYWKSCKYICKGIPSLVRYIFLTQNYFP